MKAAKFSTKSVVKLCVDVVMYVLFLLLMGQFLLRGAIHEWFGIAVGAMFLLHTVLNYKWYAALFKGRYSPQRIIQTIVNILLLIAMLGCMVSGIFVSQHIFHVGNGKLIEFGRTLHLVATAWAFILMSLHLGFHWSMAVSKAGQSVKNEHLKTVFCWIFRAVVIALCIYGVYLFCERRFWEELFHLIDFQKYYMGKSFVGFVAESDVLSVLFAAIGYYSKKWILLVKRCRNKGE